MKPKVALILAPDGSGEFVLDDDVAIGATMAKFTRELEKLGVVIRGETAIDDESAVNPMWLCG
jgi:hypothetical protein